MGNSTLQISFSGEEISGTIDAHSVVMFQKENPYNDTVSLDQLLSMSAMAKGGTSAFQYAKSTDIYFTEDGTVLNVPLIFYVLPTPSTLSYSLSLMGIGKIKNKGVVNYSITKNVIVPLTNQVEMQAPIVSNNFAWDTPCYNKKGEIVAPPAYSVNGKYLLFDETVFGVLRGTFSYTAHKYKAVLQFQKTEVMEDTGETQDVKISEVDCSVKCIYFDSKGEPQEALLELEIPKNVELFLEKCPDEEAPVVEWPETNESKYHTTYWYSTCTGEVIDFHHEEF